jgi:endo-1,4-beta-xylanase
VLSRRHLLAAAGPALLYRAKFAAAAIPGLRQIADSRGLLFGSMVRGDVLGKDRAYADLMARECNMFVCREMQFDYLEPRRSVDDFAAVDAELAWATAHAMAFRGHALVWGEHVPSWFTRLGSRDEATRAMSDHITRVCRHFAGKVQSWDVVNEGLKLEHGRPDGLRKTAFLDLIGPDYLDTAFRTAREADPKAQLVYNDFGVELDLSWHRDKRRALLALIDGLKKRGVPIDAMGLQSHLTIAAMAHFSERGFADFLRELSDRGLAILITELDVYDRDAPPDVKQRDAQIATAYRRYLDVALANKAVRTVVSWGLTDRDNWVDSKENPERRSDGRASRPLPFDTDYLPKPAYVAIAEALNAAPPR